MAAAEIRLNWSNFEAALARRIGTSAKLAQEVILGQARSLFRIVIEVTPPGHEGVKAGTRAAANRGRAKIAGDIAKLYGDDNRAYDLLSEKKPGLADAFWKARRRKPEAAAKLVREHLGASYSAFDGGALHRRFFRRGRVSVGRREVPFIFVREKQPLRAYVAEVQERVHYLAAGHERIADRLGLPLPVEISRHDAPSLAEVTFNELLLRIRATNAVKFASDTDLARRIQHAIDRQTGAMERQWREFERKMWERTGFKVRAD